MKKIYGKITGNLRDINLWIEDKENEDEVKIPLTGMTDIEIIANPSELTYARMTFVVGGIDVDSIEPNFYGLNTQDIDHQISGLYEKIEKLQEIKSKLEEGQDK